jgi:hypothetical protein
VLICSRVPIKLANIRIIKNNILFFFIICGIVSIIWFETDYNEKPSVVESMVNEIYDFGQYDIEPDDVESSVVKSDDDKIYREEKCVICFEVEPTMLITPCNHLALCDECSSNHTFEVCPVCRKLIEEVIEFKN